MMKRRFRIFGVRLQSVVNATLVAGVIGIGSLRASVDDANQNGSVAGGSGNGNALSFQADLFSGKFTYAVPIQIPPGRQGAQPTLALGYNSGAPNGWCGVGWSLDVGYIQRDGRKGVPTKWEVGSSTPSQEYDDEKGFIASLGAQGALVLTSLPTDDPRIYRSEIESTFLTYRYYSSNCWQVVDKSGNTFYLGEDESSRMENPNWATGSAKRTFKWMLNRVVDVNGNLTTLHYTNHSGQLYLVDIKYNGNVNSPGIPTTNVVSFFLSSRPDTNISYSAGYRVAIDRRLSEIRIFASGQNVRRYSLEYQSSPSTTRSLLASVRQYGSDFATELPQLTFGYQIKPAEFEGTNFWPGLNSQGQTTSEAWNSVSDLDNGTDYIVKTLDIDGDSLPDRVMRRHTSPFNAFHIERNTGSNFMAFDAQGRRYTWSPLDSQGSTGSALNSPIATGPGGGVQVELMDINGDGYPDRIMRNNTNGYADAFGGMVYHYTNFWVQYNSGLPSNSISSTSFSLKALWPNVKAGGASELESGWGSVRFKTYVDFLDINGDGLSDRVMRRYEAPFDRFNVQLNTGTGFGPLLRWETLNSPGGTGAGWNSPSATDTSGNTYVMMADINGDSLPDRIMRRDATPYTNFVVQFNNGTGFEPATKWLGLNQSQGGGNADWGSPIGSDGEDVWATLVDINGDGLIDRVTKVRDTLVDQYGTTNWIVQFNTGWSFGPPVTWKNISYQSAGARWGNISHRYDNNETLVDLMDINGDGLPDRVTRKPTAPLNAYVVQLNKGPFPDLLNVVSNGIGGSVHVDYIASSTLDNRSTNWVSDPWREGARSLLPYNTWVVSKIVTSDGLGWWSTNSYAYKGGYHNPEKREFRGFAEVEVTDPYGAKTRTYFHQGGGRDLNQFGEYQDQNSKGKKGLPFRVEMIGNNGATNKVTLNKIEEVQVHPNGCYFPFISQTIVMTYEGLNSCRATAKQLIYDTNYGNLLTEISLGEVGGVSVQDHSFSELGNGKLYTHYTYANLGEIRSKPATIKVSTDLAGTTRLKESKMFYDTRGNITNAQVWLNTSNSFISTASTVYDQYGNPVETTDAVGVKTTVVYDALKQYGVMQITGTFTNRFAHDPRAGLLLVGIDPKGMVASNYYDVFYRAKETFISTTPNGSPNLWRTRMEYSLGGVGSGLTTNCVRKRVNDAVDAVNGHESYAYMDGLGRSIQARTEAENGQFRVSHSFYDRRGNAYYSTLPVFSAGVAYTKPNGTYLGSLTEFDSIGRQFRVTPAVQAVFNSEGQLQSMTATGGDAGSPVGPVSTTFFEGTDPWVSIATDSESKVKKSYHDAFGRIVKITEVTSQGNFNTFYNYDLLGNLTNVTDHLTNKTFISYDSLGRKLAMTDPDMGTWTYAYDNAGRMIEQVDARTNKIKFFFNDVLGRMTSKQIYNPANQVVGTTTFIYDTSDDPNYTVYKGQLYKVIDQQGYTRNSYDVRDRVLKSARFLSINSMEYVSETTYDDADRPRVATYPRNSATIQYSYDTAGNLIEVKSLTGTGTSETFYAPKGFNELGQVTGYLYGNGVVTTNEFYATSKRIQKLAARSYGTNLQDLTYTYDKVSNIKSIGDNVYSNNASATLNNIQYDDLHRLVSVNSTARGTKTYSYNAIGNLIVNQDLSPNSYEYGVKPHAVTTNGFGKGYSYDACGNMVKRGSQTLVYDEQNQLIRVSNGTTNVLFGYAEGGERLWRSGTNGYTIWLGAYEINNGRVLCHVFAGGKRIASFEPECTAGLAGVFQNEQWYTATQGFNAIISWPFREGRTPYAVLFAMLAGVSVLAGRSRRECASIKGGKWLRPATLWNQAVTLTFISALILATTPNTQAQVAPPVFYYYHGDHLGTSSVLTNRSGVVVQHYENSSFGNQTYQQSTSAFPVSHRYTGQILDDETGLYYYGARYYDPEIGRFTQADTIVPSAVNPQTLNRYAYCANNPLKYVDPSGHEFLTALIVGVIVGAAIGGATAAATGGNIGMGILCGAIGGLFGGIGAGIGQSITIAGSAALGELAGAVVGGAMGGAVTSAISGGDIGMGALTGAIGGGIGFGVGRLQIKLYGMDGKEGLSHWTEDLMGFASSSAGGALGGGIGSVMQGGDFWEGAMSGAIGGAIGYAIAVDLPDALRNQTSGNERFHLFMDFILDVIPQSWLDNAASIAAGAGDVISFGLTKHGRQALEIDERVNYDSTSYKIGEAGGYAVSTAMGTGAGLRLAGTAGKGLEFSHWIPNRMGGARSLLNGNFVSTKTHALSDPFRYRFMPKVWKSANPMPSVVSQQWTRIPYSIKGTVAGGGYGSASLYFNQ